MESPDCRFQLGETVAVLKENPHGNPRTPHYVRGKEGVVVGVHGILENPRDHRGLYSPLYTVRFDLREISSCRDEDSVWVDVHEEWLTGSTEKPERQ